MDSELIAVRTFSYRPEAERAQGILEASGIPSHIRGGDASGWLPHIGLGTGGMALMVAQADCETAEKVLAEILDG